MAAIAKADNRIFFSAASGWEIAIKYRLGRLSLPATPSAYLANRLAQQGFEILPILLRHATAVADLPDHHRDPFDRLLVAQALIDGMTLVSTDEALRAYAVPILGR